jgi:hypothetical protein
MNPTSSIAALRTAATTSDTTNGSLCVRRHMDHTIIDRNLAESGAGRPAGRDWTRARLVSVAPIGMYLGIALLVFARAWTHLGSRLVGGSDSSLMAWFLAWDWYAVSHLTNPFLTDRIAVPDGANLMWNTSVPLWGVLLGPVTALAGPAASVTVAGTLALVLAASTTFVLARNLGLSRPAAVTCGLLFELSPFLYVHSANHLHMTLGAALLPLLALLTMRLATDRGRPTTTGLLLGICLAAELLTSEELLAAAALVFAAGLGVAAVSHPRLVGRRLPHLAAGSAVAVATFAVLAAWPLSVQLLGPQNLLGRSIQGDFGGTTRYSLDLANLVIPTRQQWASPVFLAPLSDRFIGTPAEQTGYLGVPLLLVLGIAAAVRRADPLVRWLLLTAVVTTVLALGPVLHLEGQAASVPLPMRAFRSTPVLEDLIPVRLMVFDYLAAALVVGLLVDWILGRRATAWYRRAAGLALVAASIATILPAGRLPATAVTPQPHLERYVAADATVLFFPYPSSFAPQGMYWSAAGGVRYRLVGGYIVVPDPARPRGSLFAPHSTSERFWAALVDASQSGRPVDDALVTQEREELTRYHIQYVVASIPDERLRATARAEISLVLQRSPELRDGALVWSATP